MKNLLSYIETVKSLWSAVKFYYILNSKFYCYYCLAGVLFSSKCSRTMYANEHSLNLPFTLLILLLRILLFLQSAHHANSKTYCGTHHMYCFKQKFLPFQYKRGTIEDSLFFFRKKKKNTKNKNKKNEKKTTTRITAHSLDMNRLNLTHKEMGLVEETKYLVNAFSTIFLGCANIFRSDNHEHFVVITNFWLYIAKHFGRYNPNLGCHKNKDWLL